MTPLEIRPHLTQILIMTAPSPAENHGPLLFQLLFVCLGNICRSPAAEGVMQRRINEAGLAEQVRIDSAGTEGWHTGKPADARMRQIAAGRAYDLTSRARQVTAEDLRQFDLILVMDHQNRRDIARFDPTGEQGAKVRLFTEFCTNHDDKEVPDPYYGGEAGFQHVLDLLEDGCENLLQHIRRRLQD
jgi:protein-tyrosine phosphatase